MLSFLSLAHNNPARHPITIIHLATKNLPSTRNSLTELVSLEFLEQYEAIVGYMQTPFSLGKLDKLSPASLLASLKKSLVTTV